MTANKQHSMIVVFVLDTSVSMNQRAAGWAGTPGLRQERRRALHQGVSTHPTVQASSLPCVLHRHSVKAPLAATHTVTGAAARPGKPRRRVRARDLRGGQRRCEGLRQARAPPLDSQNLPPPLRALDARVETRQAPVDGVPGGAEGGGSLRRHAAGRGAEARSGRAAPAAPGRRHGRLGPGLPAGGRGAHRAAAAHRWHGADQPGGRGRGAWPTHHEPWPSRRANTFQGRAV